ncbi:TetR/AcrR family transcriptional regulator [Methylocapsa polymorpha]|uniref:TetR/AcrR family transcriptional regulator n=1 Tax=Methylocapsa polymorpha TaxID=3080828 RepID=A0ABZ0HUR8_9HYPH|nr:TetR/AcrR family transcriptional regulator [Methylocapsa sp. RX1]
MSTPSKDNAVRRIPRGEKRREEIAAVAERVFLDRGFAETTMQMIAAQAGASKETLYRHFGSKEGLFSAMVRSRSARITGVDDCELPVEAPPREVLFELGVSLLRFLVSADSLALYRMVVSEAPREPELGRIFYTQGPGRVLDKLARYLGAAMRRGKLRCLDPELAAKLFLGAIFCNRHVLELVAPGWNALSDEQIQAHVEEAVSLFLARYDPDFSDRAL